MVGMAGGGQGGGRRRGLERREDGGEFRMRECHDINFP